MIPTYIHTYYYCCCITYSPLPGVKSVKNTAAPLPLTTLLPNIAGTRGSKVSNKRNESIILYIIITIIHRYVVNQVLCTACCCMMCGFFILSRPARLFLCSRIVCILSLWYTGWVVNERTLFPFFLAHLHAHRPPATLYVIIVIVYHWPYIAVPPEAGSNYAWYYCYNTIIATLYCCHL